MCEWKCTNILVLTWIFTQFTLTMHVHVPDLEIIITEALLVTLKSAREIKLLDGCAKGWGGFWGAQSYGLVDDGQGFGGIDLFKVVGKSIINNWLTFCILQVFLVS